MKYKVPRACSWVSTGIDEWSRPYILEMVPDELRSRVIWDVSYEWVELPYCEYTVVELPCLNWQFRIEILVKVCFKLRERTDGEIGQAYIGPVQWYNKDGFITPVILLPMLARGELSTKGIKVLRRSAPLTTYNVEGFSEEIVIHDLFAKLLRDITNKQPLNQALLNRGFIDGETSRLLKGILGSSLKQTNEVAGVLDPALAAQIIDKLVTLGWTKNEAVKVVNKITVSPDATPDTILKVILAGSKKDS